MTVHAHARPADTLHTADRAPRSQPDLPALVGVFKNRALAEAARAALLERAIPAGAVRLVARRDAAGPLRARVERFLAWWSERIPRASERDENERDLRRGYALLEVKVTEAYLRSRARLVLRCSGALETRGPEDDEAVERFARAFEEVAASLRRDAGVREPRTPWSEYEIRCRFGWERANRPDLQERDWQDAQHLIRAEWETWHPDIPWARAAEAVEWGWRAARERVAP